MPGTRFWSKRAPVKVRAWLQRHEPDTDAMKSLPAQDRLVGETSGKQVFDRLAGTWMVPR